jgi:hypothetical protein
MKPWKRLAVVVLVGRALVLAASVMLAPLFATAASAAPMKFEYRKTGGNHCCWWIQADGEIVADTPAAFEAFYHSLKYPPDIVRLNSLGGNLTAGVALGEKMRALGLSTEVGATQGEADKVAGICASACAYAFLGGKARFLDERARLGFHRFYSPLAVDNAKAKLFSGEDLDNTQKLLAGLLLYTISMGVDSRIIVLASTAGMDEVFWVSKKDAQELRIVFDPTGYKPWRVETYKGGALAVSESNDGLRSIIAGCSIKGGRYVAIADHSKEADPQWLEQCRVSGVIGSRAHNVFGTQVDVSQSKLMQGSDGVILRFSLPSGELPLSTPELLSFREGYPMACSTNRYLASTENFQTSVRLALRNCYGN